ncbi:MAG: Tyrosine recombinase XerD [Segetibacter sp.]|jgi:integrase/recombinase XerC/integrase/recombinase XerD|nr:Tyrosine recombinase XerD [Segetibacter sp.]
MLPKQTSSIPSTSLKIDKTSQLVHLFLQNQDVKENSRQVYKRTLNIFLSWISKKGYELSTVSRVDILHYKECMLASGMSSLTVGSYITSVRRFYEWLEANKMYPNVAKGVKSPKRKQQFRKQALTQSQGQALLNDAQEKALTAFLKEKGLRDYAIVNLLIRTGLRTVELIRANIEDVTYKGGKRVLLVHGKGRDEKDNFVVLTDKAFLPIEAYLTTRTKAKDSEPLFISTGNKSKGKRLVTRTISRIAKEGLKAIGLNNKSYTAHSLRHTTAVNILRAGGTLEAAQHVLRHSSPATTQIYTYTIKEELRLKNSAEELLDKIL